ncbi:MAG: hypothetical protein HY348_07130, partial [Nitrospira defluvii]|nr:hypothetical protein [Nitrospira defluvii]
MYRHAIQTEACQLLHGPEDDEAFNSQRRGSEPDAEESQPKGARKPRGKAATKEPTDLDNVRTYLSKIGRVSLLSREQEVEIAKQIEEGELQVRNEILRHPYTLTYLNELTER